MKVNCILGNCQTSAIATGLQSCDDTLAPLRKSETLRAIDIPLHDVFAESFRHDQLFCVPHHPSGRPLGRIAQQALVPGLEPVTDFRGRTVATTTIERIATYYAIYKQMGASAVSETLTALMPFLPGWQVMRNGGA